MPKYIDSYGMICEPTNPSRQVWYSARCTFWTDDFSTFKTVGPGIPVCPHCQSPGYQTVFSQWDRSARRHDEHVAEGYYEFIQKTKNKCLKMTGKEAFEQYQRFKDDKHKISDAVKQLIESESK